MRDVMIRVGNLIEVHGDNFGECKGCKICDEIASLRASFDADPAERYKDILEKGKDMKKADIVFLLNKEVPKKTIKRAMQIGTLEFEELLVRWELSDLSMDDIKERRRKKVESWNRRRKEEKGVVKKRKKKVETTKERYEELSELGLKDKEIAEEIGVAPSTMARYKQQWGLAQPKTHKIQASLDHNVVKRLEELEEQVKLIPQLQQEKADLHAAAADLEDEIMDLKMKVHEKQQEVDIAKLTVSQATDALNAYKRDHENMLAANREMKEHIDQHKNLNEAFRTLLKAVL
ncbi:MAG: hypothetical protein ACI35R_13180 [Bacillus sp. (in: firmicutes)]